jgi:hypothetical protein
MSRMSCVLSGAMVLSLCFGLADQADAKARRRCCQPAACAQPVTTTCCQAVACNATAPACTAEAPAPATQAAATPAPAAQPIACCRPTRRMIRLTACCVANGTVQQAGYDTPTPQATNSTSTAPAGTLDAAPPPPKE